MFGTMGKAGRSCSCPGHGQSLSGRNQRAEPYPISHQCCLLMPWVYIDDHFDEHPKVLAARDQHKDAPWLFVAGLCYSRRSNTDGLIIGPQVPRLITEYRKGARDALIDANLWDDCGEGSISVHDYTDWNRTSAAKSASARNAAQVKWSRQKDADRNA